MLDTVTLPDASTWHLAAAHNLQQKFEINSSCDTSDILGGPDSPPVATLVHPSGAEGAFTLTPTTHGRSWVPRLCRGSAAGGTSYAYRPRYFSTLSLTQKTISGPGLQNMDWSYSYGAPNASWAPCDGCPETSTTTVTDPNGNVSNYTFGNRYDLTEGQLQKLDVIDAGQGLLRSTATHYRAANAGPYAQSIGSSGQARGDGGMAEVFRPKDQQVITQQGATFTWQATGFDARARATAVTRSSSLGLSRTETTTYADNRADWTPYVLGLVETVTEANGKVMLANSYDPTVATLLTTSSFGQLDKIMSYHADGTLATRSDPLGHVTRYSNYTRGIARNVVHADSATESAEVNNIGKITAITDPNGYTTSYDYDAMGRISRFVPPAEAGVASYKVGLCFWEYALDAVEYVPGISNTLRFWRDQHRVCEKASSLFSPPNPNQMVTISDGVFEGDDVQGVRYPSPGHMSGWWITTDRYDGSVSSLRNVHAHHLSAKRPDLAQFLALTYGYRFYSDKGEVRFDSKIIDGVRAE